MINFTDFLIIELTYSYCNHLRHYIVLLCVDMSMLNSTARKRLVEQNAKVMRVLKKTITRRIRKKTGRGLNPYLNALPGYTIPS